MTFVAQGVTPNFRLPQVRSKLTESYVTPVTRLFLKLREGIEGNRGCRGDEASRSHLIFQRFVFGNPDGNYADFSTLLEYVDIAIRTAGVW